MAPKFGTSGLRGLVAELTPELVADNVRAFIAACDHGGTIFVGQDLRPSSPRIAGDIIAAARAEGIRVVDCGALPTPALAYAAMSAGAGAIMVTGSHIPADRNGLKFYVRTGEISKRDEAGISAALGRGAAGLDGALESDGGAAGRFVERYTSAFGPAALAGRKIGLYAHSAVGRDDLKAMLERIGAEVVELGRSDSFIPVDTEAVDPDTRAQIAAWVSEQGLDALVSTDGDSDRPLLADETGAIVPGDIMGQITAEALGAEAVVTPISSNSGVTRKGFSKVMTTRIGSPFVIGGMEELGGQVVGYEANGGFLLGFDAQGPAGVLSALPTRDCMLPLIVTLVAAGKGTVSARVAQEPPVITMADRLQEVPQEASQPFVARLRDAPSARAEFLGLLGATEAACDLTDGVRMGLSDGRIVHVRPSGNAPELRLYVEAADRDAASMLMDKGLAALRAALFETSA
ncbi:phosphomannomutase [Alloyangia pacifica]|uniref:Phosphomannomutase n=1 Tax=Alloyangia pacifica TaxID=311180 RepID=A0A1I6T3Y2_9RHOB|nr:phosphomannomutase [Alloyangia pacifica]SDG96313.1 phosphomannomutase [Alloyangia pacifica]SFS83770.1 phosphomannomutase [Alloyangia pacifica]